MKENDNTFIFSLLREWVELGDVIYKQQRTMIADTKIKVIDILCRKLYEYKIWLKLGAVI